MQLHVLGAVRAEDVSVARRDEVHALGVDVALVLVVHLLHDELHEQVCRVLDLPDVEHDLFDAGAHLVDEVGVPEAAGAHGEDVVLEGNLVGAESLRVVV